MTDLSHLDACMLRLSNESARLNSAKSPSEITFRTAIIASIRKEIANEYAFLGKAPVEVCDLTDEELLAELNS